MPKIGPNEAAKILGNDGYWRNFGRHIQHHPAIFKLLKNKQLDRCPVCNCGLLGNTTVHHVSYMNRCTHMDSVLIPSPTQKRPNRKTSVPPCEGCININKCASHLALVHNGCHVKIHAVEAAIKIHCESVL